MNSMLRRRRVLRWLLHAVLIEKGAHVVSAASRNEKAGVRISRTASGFSVSSSCTGLGRPTPLDPIQLQYAIDTAAAAGEKLTIRAGRYELDSTALAGRPISLRSGSTIVGEGLGRTQLNLVGDQPCTLFQAENCSAIRIEGLSMRGNSRSNKFGIGGAISIRQTSTSMATTKDICIRRCEFDNFAGEYWIWCLNESTQFAMEMVAIEHNRFKSSIGNAKGPRNIGMPSYFIAVQGSSSSLAGVVRDVMISGNIADASHVKGMCAVWQGTERVAIQGNKVSNAGLHVSDNSGAYAVLVYDNSKGRGAPPGAIRISENVIEGPRSCGVYVAGATTIEICENNISGQSDGEDSTIPKAAIALNGALDAQVVENQIWKCHGGIVLFAAVDDTQQRASRNVIRGVVGQRGFGVRACATRDVKNVQIEISDNEIDSSEGTGIALQFGAKSAIDTLLVTGNSFAVRTSRCIALNPNGDVWRNTKSTIIENNEGCRASLRL